MGANVRTIFIGEADREAMAWIRIPSGNQLRRRPGSPGELGNDLSAVTKTGKSRFDSTALRAIRQGRWAGPPAILNHAERKAEIPAANEIGTQKRPQLPRNVQ